jgi:hypothetical protein
MSTDKLKEKQRSAATKESKRDFHVFADEGILGFSANNEGFELVLRRSCLLNTKWKSDLHKS